MKEKGLVEPKTVTLADLTQLEQAGYTGIVTSQIIMLSKEESA